MAPARETPEVLIYPIRDSLYVNVTNACTASCVFCPRETEPVVHGIDLRLHRAPRPEDYVAALDAMLRRGRWQSVVFCGFGEPTLRLDVVRTVAARAKAAGLRVRLNTNGHGSLLHGREITAELRGLVDAVSVSLNAPDAASYEAVVRPHLPGAFDGVKAFILEARRNLPEVVVTAVEDVPGGDLAATRELAAALGGTFRARPLDHIG